MARAVVLLSMVLAACGDAPSPNTTAEPTANAPSLENSQALVVALQDVVDTYVLGGTKTDLQREAMTTKLVGSVVSWQFKVYDIAKEDGRYRVMSALLDGTAPDAFGKFTVVAFVTPRNDKDVETLMQLQTGSNVRIRGRVDGITMRTALVLSPAELVD